MDISRLAAAVMTHVRDYVQPAIDELVKRNDAATAALRADFVKRIEQIPAGKDGADGQAGARGEIGEKGIAGERGEPGQKGDSGDPGFDVNEFCAMIEQEAARGA